MSVSSAETPFTGLSVLVTGASQGIGRAIALHVAALGADIGMVQRGDASRAADEVRRLGRRVAVARADLQDAAAAESAVADIVRDLGRLDGCVCNAGSIHRKPALTVSLADFERVVNVNVVGTFAVARAAARSMLEEQVSGSVVLMASVLAFSGGVNVAAYAASKAAVANLARSLANEWSALGIRVNAVAPGYIENEQTRPLREDPQRKRDLDGRIPAGRWGTEEDIAHAVAFLLGPQASYVTGHTLAVDGGWCGR
jgi:2-dehydro-3-deoxy-D-gluconate 5-dehydrogenase